MKKISTAHRPQTPPLPLREVMPSRYGCDGVAAVTASFYEKRTPPSPLHTHRDCVEFVYCVRGQTAFATGARRFQLHAGSVFAANPGDLHHAVDFPKGLRTYNILVHTKAKKPLLRLAPAESRLLVAALRNIPTGTFAADNSTRALVRQVFALAADGDMRPEFKNLALRTTLTALILNLINAAGKPQSAPASHALTKIIEEMRENPGGDYSVDTLVRRTMLAPSTILNRFKAETGLPPHAYLLQCRIGKAKRLLAEGEGKIAQIARELGYTSTRSFFTAFKNVTGQTPRAWVGRKSDTLSKPGTPGYVQTTEFPCVCEGIRD